jgi:molybdenum cofactor biosynthesis enzyme MoaA
MTREEYNKLFHKVKLNLVAFKAVNDCDSEILTLVNAAIAEEREACAKLVEAEIERLKKEVEHWKQAYHRVKDENERLALDLGIRDNPQFGKPY